MGTVLILFSRDMKNMRYLSARRWKKMEMFSIVRAKEGEKS